MCDVHKNRNDKFAYIVYKNMQQNKLCIYKIICLCDDDKRSHICTYVS